MTHGTHLPVAMSSVRPTHYRDQITPVTRGLNTTRNNETLHIHGYSMESK